MRSNFDASTQLYISASAQPGNFGTKVYNALFEKHGLNAVYLARRFKDPKSLIESVRAMSIVGCSVSMPLKSQVIPFLDELEPLASRLSSVNTILNREGRLFGYNTDYVGARAVLEGMQFKSVLIYGAGSVAQTVSCILQDLSVTDVSVFARDQAKRQILAQRYSWQVTAKPNRSYDLVINVTPASKENSNHEIYELLGKTGSVFDLVISEGPTPWIAAARNRGLGAATGVMMFVHQLIRQFKIYTGQTVTQDELHGILNS